MVSSIYRIVTVLALIACVAAILFSQDSDYIDPRSGIQKLDPKLQRILIQNNNNAGNIVASNLPKGRDNGFTTVYNVIIQTTDLKALLLAGVQPISILNDFVTAEASISDILRLINEPEIKSISCGITNYKPMLDLAVPECGTDIVHAGYINRTKYTGKGAIILILDSGIDWRHPDFRDSNDTTKSRILYIWDQNLRKISGSDERAPDSFFYGVEYTKEQIEQDIRTSGHFVRATDSEIHGTYIAGIMAGNGAADSGKYAGIAPDADLIVVANNYTEAGLIDGIMYANKIASRLGRPLVICCAFGSQDGSHDGSSPLERTLDLINAQEGRFVAVSAGNEGERACHLFRYFDSNSELEYRLFIPPTSEADAIPMTAIFYLDIWFNGNQNARITIIPPDPSLTKTLSRDTTIEENTPQGTITIYKQLSPYNNKRNIGFLFTDLDGKYPPKSGIWKIIIDNFTSGGRLDGWNLYNDLGGVPAYFTNNDFDTFKTITSPGNSSGATTVGSYVIRKSWTDSAGQTRINDLSYLTIDNIWPSSSKGPTLDGNIKPDLVAPGVATVAPFSSDGRGTGFPPEWLLPSGKYAVLFQYGTSSSAAMVAGAAALMLQANPNLSGAQIKEILLSTARRDGYTGQTENSISGHGKLNAADAIAKVVNPISEAKIDMYAYDGGENISRLDVLSGVKKRAIRFRPKNSGLLSSIRVFTFASGLVSPVHNGFLKCEVYSNKSGSMGGIPDAQIGSTVLFPLSKLQNGIFNCIEMISANINLFSGTDYHIVLSFSDTTAREYICNGMERSSDGRYSIYDGSVWYNTNDAAYDPKASQERSFCIRAVVTTTNNIVWGEPFEPPTTFDLAPNYPNPFNPQTILRYKIAVPGFVALKIYDLLGREVSTVFEGNLVVGTYENVWNARAFSSGVYFSRMVVRTSKGSYSKVRKMILVK